MSDIPPPPEKPEADTKSALTAWLIPSAAVVFAAIGYIAQAGQQSLLGVETADRNNEAYINTAADFFRDSVMRLLDLPTALSRHPLLNHPVLLSLTLVMIGGSVAALLRANFRKRYGASAIVTSVACAIALAVILKFLMLDAPLLRIQDLVSNGNSCWSLAVQGAHAPANCPEVAAATGPDLWIWQEAGEIMGEMVCSRVIDVPEKRFRPLIAQSAACTRPVNEMQGKSATLDANKTVLADEFLCALLLEVITIAGAVILLGHSKNNRAAIAVSLLAILYGLTTPYAYGKVGLTPLFNFGEARISDDLEDSYGLEKPSIVNFAGDATSRGWVAGTMLHKDGAGISLLTIRRWNCPAHGGVIQTQNRASLSYIPQPQLLSFDQIRQDDLITWLINNQTTCP
jgi:hypothetical protein